MAHDSRLQELIDPRAGRPAAERRRDIGKLVRMAGSLPRTVGGDPFALSLWEQGIHAPRLVFGEREWRVLFGPDLRPVDFWKTLWPELSLAGKPLLSIGRRPKEPFTSLDIEANVQSAVRDGVSHVNLKLQLNPAKTHAHIGDLKLHASDQAKGVGSGLFRGGHAFPSRPGL